MMNKMEMIVLKSLLLLFLINSSLCEDSTEDHKIVEVKLENGVVLGKVEKSIFTKQEYYAFKGVPFAAAPIGKLRFMPPKPHQGWPNTLEAFENKPTCIQFSARMRNGEPFGISGSEDCLYISIFTPNLHGTAPVIVFDYNDNFRTGFNGTDTYSPENFMEEDVVVVTISHRLGVFGYLTTEDEVIKGNNGLRDFILGLEWVKTNIQHFGGDHNRVTLMGSCGGGTLVNMLLYSEKAKGLFSNVIMQSGNAFETSYFYSNSREAAFLLGKQFDVLTNDSTTLLEVIQQADAKDIFNKITKVLSKLTDKETPNQISSQPFSPVVESYPDAVITDLPENSKIINDVPIIIGFNSREGLDFVSHFLIDPQRISYGIEDGMLQFPIRTGYRFIPKSKKFKEARQELVDFYIESKNVDYNSILEYAVYGGDVLISYSMNHAARRLTEDLKSPIYYYMFDFRGQLNENSQYLTRHSMYNLQHWGATVGDELCYLFVCSRIRRDYMQMTKMVSEQNEQKLLKRMVRMWTNFAKTNNPTPEKDSLLKNFTWKPISKGSQQLDYLHINKTFRMATDPLQERGKFWDDFLKKYAELAVDGVVPEDDKRDEL